MTSVRILLTWAAIHDLNIYQFDCKTAFLHTKLRHPVFAKQIPGYPCLIQRRCCLFRLPFMVSVSPHMSFIPCFHHFLFLWVYAPMMLIMVSLLANGLSFFTHQYLCLLMAALLFFMFLCMSMTALLSLIHNLSMLGSWKHLLSGFLLFLDHALSSSVSSLFVTALIIVFGSLCTYMSLSCWMDGTWHPASLHLLLPICPA